MTKFLLRSLAGLALAMLTMAGAAFAQVVPTTSVGGTSVQVSVGNNRGVQLWGYSVTNGSTPGFLALLNVATVPTASASITPVECIAVVASVTVRARWDIADFYPAGLVGVFSSSCTTYTAVTPTLVSLVAR